jgi:Zn-dependent M28 family amino/carboxypeptidase
MDGTEFPEEIILIGAHYDSVIGSPGANDNASGVGALLEISKAFRGRNPPRRSLRFVAFVNEEPPFFMTNQMGSRVYVREVAKKKEKIVAMISLETLGYYTDRPKSQKYPPFLGRFYPNRGNFIAVVGNTPSRHLVKRVTQYFKGATDFPCECLAAPRIFLGIDWSDHASFWDHGYPAVMVTDTALYRYAHYHQRTDAPDHLNYPAYAKVVYGLTRVIERLANE